MLTLSICIFGFGFLLLALGLRGRVVQRGVFCRKCRFDLSGIDLNNTAAKCPECGGAVHEVEDRCETLRRRSRPALIAGLLILLVSGVGVWLTLSGNAASVYASMPDRVVVTAARLGSDAAINETIARLSRTPPISPSLRDSIIEHALHVQADRSRPWDPRLGQILLDEVTAQRLSDEQLRRYVLNGFRFEVHIRDRVHPGDDRIAYQIDTIGDRVGAAKGAVTPYRFGALREAFGIEGDEPVDTGEPDEHSRAGRLYIMSGDGTRSWLRTSIWMMRKYTTAPVGSVLPVFIDLKIRLDDPERDKPMFTKVVRFKQAVTIIEPDEPIVATIENPAIAQALCTAIEIGPLHTMEHPRAPGPNYYIPIINFVARSGPITDSFAFAVFLRVGGRELEIGKYIEQGPRDTSLGARVQWGIPPDDPDALSDALEFHAQILQYGKADVILRTNPTLAIQEPMIEQVIGTEIVFNDVPVRIVATPDEVVNPDYDQIMTSASCGDD